MRENKPVLPFSPFVRGKLFLRKGKFYLRNVTIPILSFLPRFLLLSSRKLASNNKRSDLLYLCNCVLSNMKYQYYNI
jgi:hypothetical protein